MIAIFKTIFLQKGGSVFLAPNLIFKNFYKFLSVKVSIKTLCKHKHSLFL